MGASCEACLRPASEVPAPDVAVCDSGVQLWQQPQLCSDTGHVASVRGNVPQCVGNVLQGTHRPCSPDVVFGVRGNDPLCAANVLRETCVHAPTCRADVLDLSSRQRLDDSKGKPVESSRALTDRSLGEAAQSHSSSEVQSLEGAPLFIEVCCGCARLSAHVRQCGFRVLAIDQSSNRHKPVFSVHRLDVSKDFAWELFDNLCLQERAIAIHFAPPCGTCSKARGRPLADGTPGPPALRSHEFPMGLPGMVPGETSRVASANAIYERVALFCLSHDVAWTIENPRNSWLWDLPCMRDLVQKSMFVCYDNCMFGGERFKQNALLTNRVEFFELWRECDRSHEHKSYGLDPVNGELDTAAEAEYTLPFCEAFAQALVQLAEKEGLALAGPAMDPHHLLPFKQPKGRRVPSLIKEYVRVVSLLLPAVLPLDKGKFLRGTVSNVPQGSRLLRAEEKWGRSGEGKVLCVFGVYHSKEQFVSVARQIWHPCDELMNVPDRLILCLFELLTLGPVEIAKLRFAKLKKWRLWAAELEKEETLLQQRLHPSVERIARPKRLLLLRRIAGEIGWPDAKLHDELEQGFKLTGMASASGVFRPDLRPASLSEEELYSNLMSAHTPTNRLLPLHTLSTHPVRGSRLLTQGRIFELSHAEGRSGHGGAQVAG